MFPSEVPSLKLTATEVVENQGLEAIQEGFDAVFFVQVTIVG